MKNSEEKCKLVYEQQTLIFSAPRSKCEEIRTTLCEAEPERFKKELFTITQNL